MAAAVYLVEGFRRWMRKQPLRELDLCRAVAEMSRGLIDADLGSGLVKKRIARSGAGKRGGYRVLVANREGGPWFFIEGYAKNQLDNVDMATLEACREWSAELTSLTGEALRDPRRTSNLTEVNCDEETKG